VAFDPDEPKNLTALRVECDDTAFGRAAIRRCERLHHPDGWLGGDIPWKRGSRRWKNATSMARKFHAAYDLAGRAVGTVAKVDRGQRTLTGGRVLWVGTVLEATPAFPKPTGTTIVFLLKLRDRLGRTWVEQTTIKAIHTSEGVIEC